MSDLQIYNQHAERHERAWAAFTKIYILNIQNRLRRNGIKGCRI
ncbi:hypothetical protein [Candidatus Flexifilum breve]